MRISDWSSDVCSSDPHGCYASVLAGEGSGMQRDYASHTARHLSDLEAAASIGLRDGQRAVARLNPVKIERGQMPIIFAPRIGASLKRHQNGGITGRATYTTTQRTGKHQGRKEGG